MGGRARSQVKYSPMAPASPIDADHCVAAMNISSQLNRTPPAHMIEHFLPKLQAASAEISSLLRIKP